MCQKYLGDCPRDLPAFPMKKSDFLIPCPKLIRVSEITICHVLHCPSIPTPISSRNFLIIYCEICKTSSYSCIEVNDKHRVCLPTVMAQNTEYFWLYRNDKSITL